MGLPAHGVDVAEGVVGGDPAQLPGVIHQRGEVVETLQQDLARRRRNHRRVVTLLDLGAGARFQLLMQLVEHPPQHVTADLGATAGATHAEIAHQRLIAFQQPLGIARRFGRLHFRQLLEHRHELAIDMILPAPHPAAMGEKAAFRGHRVTVAAGQQREPLLLRTVGLERTTLDAAAQVLGQRWAVAHREDAGLLGRLRHEGGDIAGGEDVRLRTGLEVAIDRDETALIDLEIGARRPGLGSGRGRQDHLIDGDPFATGRDHVLLLQRHHLEIVMHDHAFPGEALAEIALHPRIVIGQDRVRSAEQMELEAIAGRIAVPLGALPFQPVLHRQQHLDPGRARADDAEPQRLIFRHHAGLDAIELAQEVVDRLDRNQASDVPRDTAGIRRGADIDRHPVIANSPVAPGRHLLGDDIEAHHAVLDEHDAGPGAEATQIDMRLLEAVVAGDIARQHAGIAGHRIPADQHGAQAGNRFHRQRCQHLQMAVATTDENQLSQLRRGLNRIGAHVRTAPAATGAKRKVCENPSGDFSEHRQGRKEKIGRDGRI